MKKYKYKNIKSMTSQDISRQILLLEREREGLTLEIEELMGNFSRELKDRRLSARRQSVGKAPNDYSQFRKTIQKK